MNILMDIFDSTDWFDLIDVISNSAKPDLNLPWSAAKNFNQDYGLEKSSSRSSRNESMTAAGNFQGVLCNIRVEGEDWKECEKRVNISYAYWSKSVRISVKK